MINFLCNLFLKMPAFKSVLPVVNNHTFYSYNLLVLIYIGAHKTSTASVFNESVF